MSIFSFNQLVKTIVIVLDSKKEKIKKTETTLQHLINNKKSNQTTIVYQITELA